ncbi:hypothetical protein [Roseibaca sp. Y0-43]|uniref:hypothetical protein n=1 Tax=Roseibaca sp. Y0-43 TaxID=2816854 RepID=UPI001D0C0BEC|nr:hypothetical protein [Roseibaca sp. Y0-43]MCC1481282.1 hypothetical protein [Roseibaca sp. Y0-43]
MNFRAVMALGLALGGAMAADAQTWTERKCTLYAAALEDALGLVGRDGISDGFLTANAAFIAQGCTERGRICPKSDQERALADLLTVMTMNEGMASTFVPFACPG